MPLSQTLLDAAIDHVRRDAPALAPVELTPCTAHSNDRVSIRFSDGRTLIVKRARYAWAAPRFEASRRACALIAERTGILAPRPLPLPADDGELPVEAYWRIDRPVLSEVWSGLDARTRAAALREWGRLAAELHGVRFPAHGALSGGGTEPLADDIRRDVGERLLGGARAHWPAAVPVLERLADRADAVAARADARGVLVHNDLHMDNVLVDEDGDGVRGVGVLDLEAASAGPPEAELAHMEVLHAPLFDKPLPAGWADEVLRGYGRPLDPVLRAFYRAVHLLNLGYHAAFTGLHHHAADVLRAAELDAARI